LSAFSHQLWPFAYDPLYVQLQVRYLRSRGDDLTADELADPPETDRQDAKSAKNAKMET
jgi:hypothetical protein